MHILQNADMQITCGFPIPTFPKILQDIDFICQKYCKNLTFWKYFAQYWLNLISSRSNLCACARCKPKVAALIYWKSSLLWESRSHNFYPYFQRLSTRGGISHIEPLGLYFNSNFLEEVISYNIVPPCYIRPRRVILQQFEVVLIICTVYTVCMNSHRIQS